MKNSTQKSGSKMKMNLPKPVKVILVAVAVAAVVCQIILDIFLYQLLVSGDRGATITQLIGTAVTNLVRPVVTGTDGRQYVPAAHVVLPAVPDDAFTLLYSGFDLSSNAGELHLTTSTALNRHLSELRNAQASQAFPFRRYDSSKGFETVPALQACARGYTIRFNGDTSGYDVKVGSIKLSDGRTATIGREKLCTQLDSSTDAYIKQTSSY